MLNKARSLYDTLKSSWNAGSNEDDIQLALYAAAEEEFESGNTKKGLLAKVSVEANYDDKVTKAKYIKARVDVLMSKRNDIARIMKNISSAHDKIQQLSREITGLSHIHASINQIEADDYQKAELDFEDALTRAVQPLAKSCLNYESLIPILLIVGLVILVVVTMADNSLVYNIFLGLLVFNILFIARTAFGIYQLSKKAKKLREDEKIRLEAQMFLENSAEKYAKRRRQAAQEQVVAMKNLITEKEQEIEEYQVELKNIFS